MKLSTKREKYIMQKNKKKKERKLCVSLNQELF